MVADVEVALAAVMELISFFEAEVALPEIVEFGIFKGMFEVASVQFDRSAL